jgi:dynein heavy chain
LISPELEAMLTSINQNVVPKDFAFAYFSMKPLAAWFEDLKMRYEFFYNWSVKGIPYV